MIKSEDDDCYIKLKNNNDLSAATQHCHSTCDYSIICLRGLKIVSLVVKIVVLISRE